MSPKRLESTLYFTLMTSDEVRELARDVVAAVLAAQETVAAQKWRNMTRIKRIVLLALGFEG